MTLKFIERIKLWLGWCPRAQTKEWLGNPEVKFKGGYAFPEGSPPIARGKPGVIASFKDSLVLVANNPVILLITLIIAALSTPLVLLQTPSGYPSAPIFWILTLGMWLLMPFFQGGIFSMIGEAYYDGKTGLATFIKSGKKNYPRLLVCMFIFMIATALPVMIFAIGGGIALVFLKDFSLSFLPLVAGVFVAGFLTMFAILFFLQFYDVGVVFKGYGIIEALVKSAGFVWRRKRSVLGYTLLYFGCTLLIIAPTLALGFYFVYSTRIMHSTLPQSLPFLKAALNLILGTIVSAVLSAFHGVFYIQQAGE